MYAFPFSLMYLLFCTDFYIFRNFVFFVFLVVQYRRSVIYKIKRLDTNTRDFGYTHPPFSQVSTGGFFILSAFDTAFISSFFRW